MIATTQHALPSHFIEVFGVEYAILLINKSDKNTPVHYFAVGDFLIVHVHPQYGKLLQWL